VTAEPVLAHEAFVGALVSWLHVPRGGYGLICPIDAKIVALSLPGDRATIEVSRRDGRKVRRTVHVASLRWRGRS
jgi:hypothetical protein